MTRGRKPKPTAVKEANGAFRINPNRRNHNEPQTTPGKPRKPTTLNGDKVASAMWSKVCKLLAEINLLTTTDVCVIESFCLNESKMVKAAKQIEEFGMVTESGRANPANLEWNKAMDRRIKLMAELGLTASARTRMVASPKEDKDPFIEFLEMSKQSKN